MARDYRRIRRAKAVAEFGGKCVKCGSDDRLQFDHINPATKLYRVVELWDSSRKWAIERDKLQLLCYTCHRAKTISEQTKPLEHGTINAYNRKGCRCRPCTDYAVSRAKQYKKQGSKK